MYDWQIEKAKRRLENSRSQKGSLTNDWNNADLYYGNDILDARDYKSDKLVDADRDRVHDKWGIDNQIPDNVRKRIAYAATAPLDVDMNALAPTDDFVAHEAVNGIYKSVLHELENKEFDRVKRDIMTRSTLFNMAGLLDWWEDDGYDPKPAYRVISHDDLFMDTTATSPANETGGPRWIAIRRMLTEDQKLMRYGRMDLKKGFSESDKPLPTQTSKSGWEEFEDQYEIFEWFGIDEEEETISSDEMVAMVTEEINELFAGTLQDLDEDINHRKAVEIGDGLMRDYAIGLGAQFDEAAEINSVLNALSQNGLNQIVELYGTWRREQIDMAAESDGGTKPKYPGYIYRVEFSLSHPEPLIGPEPLDHAHFQMPVSLFWSQQPTSSLWRKGLMSEVLSHQEWIEWWQKCQQDYSHYAARPPMIIDGTILDPPARDDRAKKKVVTALRKGFRVLWLRLKGAKAPMDPHFAQMGRFPIDVGRIIEYHQFRIKEILGPTPTLTGSVSGETSGRAFGMRSEAAGRPVMDMLKIAEGPMEAFVKRMSVNTFEYGDLNKIESIAGRMAADAIEQIRMEVDAGTRDFRYAVQADLGSGVPRDFYSLVSLAQAFPNNIDMEELGKAIKSPITLRNIPQPAPGGVPGQGGSIDKGLIPTG